MQADGYHLNVQGGNNGSDGTIVFAGNPDHLQQLPRPPRSRLAVVRWAAARLPSVVGVIDAEASAAAEEALKAAAAAAGQPAAAPPPAIEPLAVAVEPTSAAGCGMLAALGAAPAADAAEHKVGKVR
jgi:hypothetical protein